MTTQQLDLPIKPRKAWVAFLFSFIFPGLGQIYNGQVKKGILFFILPYCNVLVFGLTRGVLSFHGLLALLLIELLLRLCISIDAAKVARKQKEYLPKVYNKWYYYLLILGVMVFFNWIFNVKSVLGIESFHMPYSVNEPTIQQGDLFMADMKAYINKNPEYGDLVMYKQKDGFFYASRVVGLPGDTIALDSDIVSINGKMNGSMFLTLEFTIEYAEGIQVKVDEFEETLPNGHLHKIYKINPPMPEINTSFKSIIVPANSYFLVSDNRDLANDSRYLGPIKKQDIYGRVIYSYWGKKASRINVDFRNK